MKIIFVTILLALLATGSAFAKDLKTVNRAGSNLAIKESANTFEIELTKSSKELKIREDKKEQENQLPVQAKRTFAKMFEGYTIKQTLFCQSTEGQVFYINAENEKETLIIKINEAMEISIFKKSK